MRRASKERQDARRELATAIIDHDPKASAAAREKAEGRIRKAARLVLGHVLTDADKRWIDRIRPKRGRKADDSFRQTSLVEEAPASPSKLASWASPQPACTECGTTGGIKRYDKKCAACADRADHRGRP